MDGGTGGRAWLIGHIMYGYRYHYCKEVRHTIPRQAKPDAPGTLHHVIIRGIESKEIVKDDHDRQILFIVWARSPCKEGECGIIILCGSTEV